jgi:hypothetical protein
MKFFLSTPGRRSRGIAPLILDLAGDESEWLASRPGRFISRKVTRYPLKRSLDGFQSRPGLTEKREKNLLILPGFEPAVVQLVATVLITPLLLDRHTVIK